MTQDSSPFRRRGELVSALRQIIRGVDLHSRALLKDYGVTAPQLLVLRELSRDGDQTLGSIARAVKLSPATVTGIVSRLEAKGDLIRERNHKDKRRVHARLTPHGHTLLGSLSLPVFATLNGKFERLDEKEQAAILSSLQRVAAMLGDTPNDPSERTSDSPISPGL